MRRMIRPFIYITFLCLFLTTPTQAEPIELSGKLDQLTQKNFFRSGEQAGSEIQNQEDLQSLLKNAGPQARADGGWSGGGGGGIECDGRVYTLDYFEHKDRLRFFQPENFVETIVNNKIRSNPKLIEKRELLLAEARKVKLNTHSFLQQNVVSRMRFISPILTERLAKALEVVSKSGWQLVDSLPLYNDVGSAIYPKGCKPVQLAIRFQQKIPNSLPRTVVYVDRTNLEKMLKTLPPQEAFINLALLVLHEATYLLGMDMGQDNSNQARKITASLLSKDFYETLEMNGYWSASIYDRLSEFDFFSILFSYEKTTSFENAHLAKRNRLRLEAFKKIQSVLMQLRIYYINITTDVKSAFLDYLLTNGSPEEVFLELGRQAQAQRSLKYSIEYLFVNQSEYLSTKAEKALCDNIKTWEHQTLNKLGAPHYVAVHLGHEKGLAFLQKGKAYCQSFLP